jgi:hypothetical protein
MFILAIGVLIITLYYLFIKKVKEEGKKDTGKPIFYFLLVVSAIIVIWGIISIILALINGSELNISKPSLILFITSILVVITSSYDLIFRKKKWPQYSWFIAYFLLVYCSIIVVWGIVSFIVY